MGYGFFQTRHSAHSPAEAHGGREPTLQGVLWLKSFLGNITIVLRHRLSNCPSFPVSFPERTYEGGGPALPVRPEEASSRGPRRGAERAQRPAGLPLPKPFPLPQENQCEPHSCIKLLMHYLALAGL